MIACTLQQLSSNTYLRTAAHAQYNAGRQTWSNWTPRWETL